MLQHIKQDQLARDLVLFFERPEKTRWLHIFQDDFAYVIIQDDFRITLNENKPLVLYLTDTQEITQLPTRLKETISNKLKNFFNGC